MPVYRDNKTKTWYFRTYANDVYGNRKQFERDGFTTKKEAQKAESDFKALDPSDISNMKFIDLWEAYKNYKQLQLKKQSYRAVESRFRNYILPYFKDYKINKITNNVYIKWQMEIESKGFKHKYNSSLHGAMVNILNYAIKFYGLKENIASLTGNFKRKTELKKNVDFWTYEEYKQFISVVNDNVYNALFETLYYTGLREGEALALNWNDFTNDSLDINKTISKELIDNKRVINTPKTTKSNRIVKLDNKLVQKLNELKDYYMKFEGLLMNGLYLGFKSIITYNSRKKKE